MSEGKRTVKDHGQPEVGDWLVIFSGLERVVSPHVKWADNREWLPASAVVIPDHYAPVPRPEPLEIGQWVSAFDGAYTGRIGDAQWCESMGRYSYKVVGVGWISPNDFTKVDPPFPSSLSAVGWRPRSDLTEESVDVWVLLKDGQTFQTEMSLHVNHPSGFVAWAPVIGAPPVPSDWSPA